MSKYIIADSTEVREMKQEIEKLRKTESELQNRIKKLESSESLLRTIIDNAPFEIWARNKDGIGIFENNATAKHFGSILGKTTNTHDLSPEVFTIWKANNEKVFQGEIIDEECEFNFGDQRRNYHQIIAPIISGNSIEGIAGFNIDITERKQAQKAILDQNKVYRNLVERLPDGVYKSTHSGKFIDVNPALVKMLGYQTKEELLAIDIKTQLYFQPDDRESLVLQEKYEEMGIFRLKKKDGSEIWVEDHGWYTLDKNGEILYHEGIMRDITERKMADDAMKESEERFKMLFDQAPVGYQSLDEKGFLIDVNKTWLEMMGYPKKDIIGNWFGDFLTPAYRELFRKSLLEFMDNGVVHSEMEMIRKNGSVIVVQLDGRIAHKASGAFKQTHCVLSDITERRKAEKAIADDRILLRTLIDSIPDAIYVKDTLGRKLISNKADLEILGITDEKEVLGKTDLELSYPGDASQTLSDDISVIQTAQPVLNRLEIFNDLKGTRRYFSTSKIPLTNDLGEIIGLIGVGHEITNQKINEQKITQLSKGIEQSPASFVITDTHGEIEYVNKKFLSVSGYLPEELIGKVIRILKPGHTNDETYSGIWSRLNSGQEWRGEHQNITKNRIKYWESVLISPIKNQEGKITNYIILSEDISERKQMEEDLILAKEKAEESDRLKSAFLANMSHEIRTPLNSILGFSDLLTDPELNSESRIEFASLINSSGNNLLAIINDVLDISRIEAGQITLTKHAFPANKLISEIQKEYAIKAGTKGIELRLDPQSSNQKIVILSDEIRIKQVLINFIGNALKFTESGYIEIGIKLINNNVQFHVKDTGIGIDKEFHDKIFDRFRQVEASSTRKYGGNGLGLAITKNLAELLGGSISLESEPDKGSTFFFTLPEICIVKKE